jgi:tetratricopeptide (TPR) repeat protein
MRTILYSFGGALLPALIACLGLTAGPSSASASVGLAPAAYDAELAPIARGFDGWLATALQAAGVTPVALPVAGEDGLAAAAAAGLELALVPRLGDRGGQVEVHLALYAPATGQVLDARMAQGALAFVGNTCSDALSALAPSLGIQPEAITAPGLSDLASTSQALAKLDDGRLYDAWRSVQGKLSPVAMSTRDAIGAQARRPGDSASERARVLAASGDVITAWGLVGSKATLSLRKQEPDVAVLLAAGEIQLARENPRQALRFLEIAATHAPDSLDVQISLARARLAQNDPAAARDVLLHAKSLDSQDTRALEMLMEIDAGQPRVVAAHKLEVASRLVAGLEADLARRHLEETPGLDPSTTAQAALQLGALEARLGRHDEALAAYNRAIQAGASGPAVLVGKGRSEHALGHDEAAEHTLRRAISLAPDDAPALVALGSILSESDRNAEAIPLLRKARVIQPADPQTHLSLARALRLNGEYDEAIEVLAAGGSLEDVQRLRELARSQTAAGDLEGADTTLLRAVRLVPNDADLREQRARVLDASGNTAEAEAERALATRVSGSVEDSETIDEELVRRVDFDAIASSFAQGHSEASRTSVAFLGLREPGGWMSWLRRLTRLREPSTTAVEQGLIEALAVRFGHVAPVSDLGALENHVDQLYDFEGRNSLSAELVSAVNSVIGSDGVFVSRLVSHPGDRRDLSCADGAFALETRLLLGSDAEYVGILASTDCIEAGLETYASWNIEAFVVYALLAIFVIFPVVRGWGTVVVRIQLPDKTKGFFSVHVTTKPDQVTRDVVDKKTGREKIRAKRRLDLLRRFSRHMVGRETRFKWIPARAGHYTITVGGPLLDARGEEVVGFFLEEQKAHVRRGGVTELDYDFRPQECAVEVKVAQNGEPAAEARVAVAGDPSSLRYARDGVAFLYVGKGEYTILVGTKDAAAEFRIFVDKLDAAVPLHVDLGECEVIFRNCPSAVEPYLQGDLDNAAAALERDGNSAAARVRAELFERQGRAGDAAVALESVGDLGQAAALRASDADHSGSAALYEQAGDHANAAAAHRAAGEWEEAARCYEEIYDYGNALECWRELGNEARELDLLEKLGEYQDAAEIARQMGDLDRAIQNLQQVDQRHPSYRQVCRVIAEIVSERGDHELAVAKFEEALGSDGLQSASVDALESFAAILERAGKHDEAISTYEVIQRRDVARTDLSTRIQELRAESQTAATQAVPETSAAPAESRYELLDEIGRGGMGVVYKARDKRLGRIVALKRLPDNLRDHPTAVLLFEREARAAAALNHQNIVTLFDAGEEGGAYFITMELLEGRALNEILASNQRISVRDTARLGLQIAAGMQYAHERRIVHRDIKTANLFFTNDQIVKIMDFGIAKSLEEVRRSTTVVGGTPYYMAPEQAKGEGVDHRADIYAFGVTLYQLVTGSLPFTEGDVAYLHTHEPPPDPREIQVDIPAAFAGLVLTMMAKLPDERPDDANAVAEALRSILSDLG